MSAPGIKCECERARTLFLPLEDEESPFTMEGFVALVEDLSSVGLVLEE